MFAELHSHLYGCLTPDDLRYLKARNGMRTDFFRASHERAYGRTPDVDSMFQDDAALSSVYHFRGPPDFAKFQTSFDLVISLSKTDPEELREIVLRVAEREPARFAEYRQLFSPALEIPAFEDKVSALLAAISEANRMFPEKTFRLAMSVPRDPVRGPEFLDAVYRAAAGDSGHLLTGIDFCAQEEGYPPSSAADMLSEIRSRTLNGRRLSILYHAGESFTDKSVESAVRWIVQAAELGAARLGHAAALGLDPAEFAGTVRREIAGERMSQIEFELENSESLAAAGIEVDAPALRRELLSLKSQPGQAPVHIAYDGPRTLRLGLFQDWAMERVKRTGAVIECCPSSNAAIVGFRRRHPVFRFLEKGMRVVIGADDPGIFDTDLLREFELLRSWGMPESDIEQMQRLSLGIAQEISGGV